MSRRGVLPNVRRFPSIIPASRRFARAAEGDVGVFGDFPFFSFSFRRTLETPVRFRYNRRNREKRFGAFALGGVFWGRGGENVATEKH